jgi:hypothetical protein
MAHTERQRAFKLRCGKPEVLCCFCCMVGGWPCCRPVSWVWFPIDDFSVTSAADTAQMVEELARLVHCGHTLYLHCLSGRGRTGTVRTSPDLKGKSANDQLTFLQIVEHLAEKKRKKVDPSTSEPQRLKVCVIARCLTLTSIRAAPTQCIRIALGRSPRASHFPCWSSVRNSYYSPREQIARGI